MNPDLFIHYLVGQWQHTSPWEVLAVVFGVLEVLLAYRNNVLLYPAGIVSTGIYTWLFLRPETGLYADAALNIYYFGMSIYGWYLWRKRSKNHIELAISSCSFRDWKIAAGIFGAAFILLFFVLRYATDSTVPFEDALVSALAWTGMWLLAKRKIENWIVLNLSNAVAIPLLLYKKMPLTALLTVFLFMVATFGYFKWRRIWKNK
jgi:nicotinamide mononucleotide transporter